MKQGRETLVIDPMPMALEEVACPLCAATGSRDWGRENGFRAGKCDGCGFVYVSPRPSAEHITAATELGQHRHESGTLEVIYSPSRRKVARYRRRLAPILQTGALRNPVSWLDVGAGFGELMEAVRDLLPPGSEVTGIEPMRAKAEHAAARGLAISSIPLNALGRQFDYVSLVNIFSHVGEPARFLGEVAALVKPGGSLLLVTGNGGDLASADEYPDRLDLPDHLAFAGRGHIVQLLEGLGLAVEHIDARRLDTAAWAAKALVKRCIGQPVPIVTPYRSGFRDILYVARKPAGAASMRST